MSAPVLPDELLKLIRHFEGLSLVSYQDEAGVWTIGYGHTDGVTRGMQITQQDAERFLRIDAAKALGDTLVLCPTLVLAPAGRLIAIADFTFNLGSGRLRDSTLRRYINAGNLNLVPDELRRWVYVTDPETGEKKQSRGLIKRREAECSLWESAHVEPRPSTEEGV